MTDNRNNWQEAAVSGLVNLASGDNQHLRILSSDDEEQLAMMVHHHPDDALLLDYATGALGEAESLVVATHIALCPLCRRKVAEFEAIGGAALDQVEQAPMADDALEHMMARLDASLTTQIDDVAPEAHAPDTVVTSEDSPAALTVPQPLRGYLQAELENLPWQNVIRGLDEVTLEVGTDDKVRTKMLRIQPGCAMPQHTHDGAELTLVLDGAFSDERGYFARGDLAVTGVDVEHRPIADDKRACYCLAVTTAPLRLTGPLGRLINPFIKY
ncbi:MAG: ChrR family anti-sigma-E factor [Pseudomonadota bacterium]